MTTFTYSVIAVALVALCTVFTRALPFLLFAKRRPSARLEALGDALPPAVIAILIVYSVRDMHFLDPASVLPKLIAMAGVVLLHVLKRNTLLSIVGGTFLYMLLIRLV